DDNEKGKTSAYVLFSWLTEHGTFNEFKFKGLLRKKSARRSNSFLSRRALLGKMPIPSRKRSVFAHVFHY
ncbi:hypothetical protein CROQUDRAFT_698682, partial [Cronartium quercuum f. sp. fusiforme G11]